jgi:hypothetical protein
MPLRGRDAPNSGAPLAQDVRRNERFFHGQSMTAAIVILLVFAASIVACHLIAKHRGKNPVFWGVMGAIFGPLAIPVALMLKVKGQK